MADIKLIMEAEKRGLLPPDKIALLDEARKRGLIESESSETDSKEGFGKSLKDVGLAVATGARNYPGLKQVSAGVGTAIRGVPKMLRGEDVEWGKEYDDRLKKQARQFKDIETNAPTTALVSDVAAQVPLYTIGGEMLPALSWQKGGSLLANLLKIGTKGATVNTAIQQAEHPDLGRIPTDVAVGAAMEPVGIALSGIAKKIPGLARNVGGRLNESLFRRGTKTLEHELAGEEGKTLGQEIYDRGNWGSLSKLLGIAQEGQSKFGGQLDDMLTRASKSKPEVTLDQVNVTTVPEVGVVDGAKRIDNQFYINELKQLRNKSFGIKSREADVSKIDEIIQSLEQNPENLTPARAQEIKQAIYDTSENAYLRENAGLTKELDKAQARGYKKGIEELFVTPTGENPVRDLNKQLSYYTRLGKSLGKTEARIAGTNPIPDRATGVDLLKKLIGLDSPSGATGTAQALKSGSALLSPVLDTLGKGARTVVPSFLEDLLRLSGDGDIAPQPIQEDQIQPPEAPFNFKNDQIRENAEGLKPDFVEALQKVMQDSGVSPTLTSALRNPETNAAVGGVPGSKHLTGEAIDASIKNLTPEQIQEFLQAANSNPNLRAFVHSVKTGPHLHTEYR